MKKESSHHEMKDCGRLPATATQIASVTYGAVQLLSLHGHTALLDARHHSSNSTNGVVSRVEQLRVEVAVSLLRRTVVVLEAHTRWVISLEQMG